MPTEAVSERVETIVSHALVVIQPISRTFCGVSDTYKQLSRRLSSDLEAKQLRVALSRAERDLIRTYNRALGIAGTRPLAKFTKCPRGCTRQSFERRIARYRAQADNLRKLLFFCA